MSAKPERLNEETIPYALFNLPVQLRFLMPHEKKYKNKVIEKFTLFD